MFYRLNSFVFIRNINNYLQIIDKRDDSEIIGDYSSFLFAKNLDYMPQELETIVTKICSEFSGGVDFDKVKIDAAQFLEKLVNFGLVSKGNSIKDIKDVVDTGRKIDKILLPKNELTKYQDLKNENPCLQNVVVEITKKCNERCVHCYIPHDDKNAIISDDDFYDIVDQCHELNTVVNFRISGGECMCHHSFKNYIKYVKEKGFSLCVLTNLTLLDDEIISILKDGLLSKVQVSLFSLKPEIHDKITSVNGSLEKTLKNLERLYKAGIFVEIATQAMEINKNSIEDLYKYAEERNFKLRCDWTIIAREDRSFCNLSCRIKNMSDYQEICRQKIYYTKGYGEELKRELSLNPKPGLSHLCNAGFNGLQIDANMEVHPCPGWDLSLGNLKEHRLQDIWMNSKELEKVRNVVLNDFPKCARCDIRNLCSICMAQADLEMNSSNFKFEMPEYVCQMYKTIYDTIKKEVLEK